LYAVRISKATCSTLETRVVTAVMQQLSALPLEGCADGMMCMAMTRLMQLSCEKWRKVPFDVQEVLLGSNMMSVRSLHL
jgi:hypothetical protein